VLLLLQRLLLLLLLLLLLVLQLLLMSSEVLPKLLQLLLLLLGENVLLLLHRWLPGLCRSQLCAIASTTIGVRQAPPKHCECRSRRSPLLYRWRPVQVDGRPANTWTRLALRKQNHC
jgi:hypothetical protein